ncbi:MFS transporter [Luminiphilus sp.]|nr:MFS transporter [Luminiphilus sp.]MDA9711596.1 MFS transporter [Luminiphilus sp.]
MTDSVATGSLAGTERLDRQSLLLLFIGLYATAIGQAFVYAILPPLGRSVGLDEIRITAIISLSALVFTLVAPFWGRFSDQRGRKPVILIGLMGYCIGSLAFAVLFSLAEDGVITGLTLFIIALIIRSLQASTMSATNPGCTAYAADHTEAQFRIKTLARLSTAQSIGMITGPVMAGILAGLGLLAPLVAASILSGLAAAIIALKLSEGVTPRIKSTQQRRLGFFDNRLRDYLISAIGAFTGVAMVQQTLAFRLQDALNLSGIETARYTGWAMMVSAASILFMQMAIAQRFTGPPIQLVRWGGGLLLVGTVIISALNSWGAVLTGMALIGAGLGLLMPAVAAGASLAVGPEEQGGVSGLVGACPAAGFVLGPISGGVLYQYNQPAAGWGAVLILLIVFVATLRPRRHPAPSSA